MVAETSVTVTARVGDEVSSAVMAATTTPDVGFWQEIINWVMGIFS
jgi:hypothetical protein